MNFKKMFSSLAIVGAVATLMGASAMAGSFTVTASPTTAKPGDTVTVTVKASNMPSIGSMVAMLDFGQPFSVNKGTNGYSLWECDACGIVDESHDPETEECGGSGLDEITTLADTVTQATSDTGVAIMLLTEGNKYELYPDGTIAKLSFIVEADATAGDYSFDLTMDSVLGYGKDKVYTADELATEFGTGILATATVTVSEATNAVSAATKGSRVNEDGTVNATGSYATFYFSSRVDTATNPGAVIKVRRGANKNATVDSCTVGYFKVPDNLITDDLKIQAVFKTNKKGYYWYNLTKNDGTTVLCNEQGISITGSYLK